MPFGVRILAPYEGAAEAVSSLPNKPGDSLPSGDVSSGGDGGTPSFAFFDGNKTNSYSMGPSGNWLQRQTAAFTLAAYAINMGDAATPLINAPSSWEVAGSTNGVSWRVLHKVTGEVWPASTGVRRVYLVPGADRGLFAFHRFTPLAAQGGGSNLIRLAELELLKEL